MHDHTRRFRRTRPSATVITRRPVSASAAATAAAGATATTGAVSVDPRAAMKRGAIRGARAIAVSIIAALATLAAAACGGGETRVVDAIPDIPASQQRAVARTDFDWQWPFSIGQGTLGCLDDAIVFRYDGKTYALNEAARARGFAIVDPIWRVQASGMPRDPLRRIAQEQRQAIFLQSMACDGDGSLDARTRSGACKRALRELRALSDAELQQIEAEGRERLWPPLTRTRASLDPIIAAGRALCAR